MKIFFSVFLLFCLSASSCVRREDSRSSAGKSIRLEIASAYTTSIPILGSNIKNIAARMDEVSAGSIKTRVLEPQDVGGLKEVLDAVSSGKVDAGCSAAGFWAGKMPAAPLFSSIPFGPDINTYLAWMKEGNGLKYYQQMYDDADYNVKVFVCCVLPPETSGWFAKEINNAEDLKGLKMRFFGLGARVMEKLQVSTVLLGGSEIYQALEKGVIDATEFSMPSIDQNLGFHKLVKFNYFPGWHQQATFLEFIINKDKWNELSKTQKSIIEMACNEGLVNSMAEGEGAQFSAMRENVEKNKVVLRQWSPEMLSLFRAKWHEVVIEESEKNAFFKFVWEDLKKFREDYKIWGSNAFLPREK